jgi:hypothetical protein
MAQLLVLMVTMEPSANIAPGDEVWGNASQSVLGTQVVLVLT